VYAAASQYKGDLGESTHTYTYTQKESRGNKREESDIRTHYIARYLILSLFYYLYRHQGGTHIRTSLCAKHVIMGEWNFILFLLALHTHDEC
jgi:hypothetical protein